MFNNVIKNKMKIIFPVFCYAMKNELKNKFYCFNFFFKFIKKIGTKTNI
jgi:hypothetical protein